MYINREIENFTLTHKENINPIHRRTNKRERIFKVNRVSHELHPLSDIKQSNFFRQTFICTYSSLNMLHTFRKFWRLTVTLTP